MIHYIQLVLFMQSHFQDDTEVYEQILDLLQSKTVYGLVVNQLPNSAYQQFKELLLKNKDLFIQFGNLFPHHRLLKVT